MNSKRPNKNNAWDSAEKKTLSDSAADTAEHQQVDSYDRLRNLIVGPERQQILEIQNRLDDPLNKAEEISQALPDAILLGTTRDNRIAEAMQPAMDVAIKTSVRKNPKILADAIYPILLPGVRKAVTSILMGMIQSLNRMLDTAFSFQGIKWRLEALRSHRPFAEIVLLHTLVYRIEQLFLIHRSTGLVLQHVESMDVKSKDPDLVSGMLTAIQNFITDSFPSETSTPLETLRMGSDLSVWIEQGQYAILAAVIRGTPPLEQREKLENTLEDIHLKYGAILEAFQGNTEPFVVVRHMLEERLDFQIRQDRKRTSPMVWALLALVLFAAGFMWYHTLKAANAWEEFIRNLKAEPGIVLIDYGREDGNYFISGLRDPLAKDSMDIEMAFPFKSSIIFMSWKPYYSVDPEIVFRRAEKLLAPPQTVHLSLADNSLTAQGTVGHDWISVFRQRAVAIAGIDTVNMDGLIDQDTAAIENSVKRLEMITVSFPLESPVPEEGQEETFGRMLSTLQDIQKEARKLKAGVKIVITGHTDPSGTDAFNRRLSKDRAETILAYLIDHGINSSILSAIGIGSKIRQSPGEGAGKKIEPQRMVTFETQITYE